jgi:hypothetical protein
LSAGEHQLIGETDNLLSHAAMARRVAENFADPSYGTPSAVNPGAAWLAKTKRQTRKLLRSAYCGSRHASNRLLAQVRIRGRRMKDERPIVLLGLIAGSAFLLGLTLRLWRVPPVKGRVYL